MSKWKKYSLEDLAFYYNGKAFKPSDWKKEGVKIIRIEQLNNPTGFYDYYQGEISEVNSIINGDLIFSWSATLKVLIWKHGKAVLNQHLFKVIPKQFVDKHFLFYLLDSNMEKLGDSSHGSTMKHIKRGELEKYFVKIPEKDEQRQIAHILSTCDAVIDKTQSVIAKYKAIKQGMLHDLFTRGIDIKTGKLRPKYAHAPELYKESKLGWIPKAWFVNKLGEYAFITKLAGFEYTLYFDYSKSGPIIAVRALNIKQGKLSLENIHTIPKDTSDILPRSQLYKGDLVISYVGTVGEVAVIPESNKFHLAPNVAKISVDKKLVNPFYLNQFLNADVGQKEIIKLVSSTTQAALSMHNLREVMFIKPEMNEQILIENKLASIDKIIEAEQSHLQKLQQIKSGLMNDLLSGKKKVKLIEDLKVEKAL